MKKILNVLTVMALLIFGMALQTLMNVYGIRPGDRVLMVGAGNIGVIVSYQLLQAGRPWRPLSRAEPARCECAALPSSRLRTAFSAPRERPFSGVETCPLEKWAVEVGATQTSPQAGARRPCSLCLGDLWLQGSKGPSRGLPLLHLFRGRSSGCSGSDWPVPLCR